MAKPQEKQAFPSTTTAPIIEHDQEGLDMDGDDYPETSSAAGCGCFRLFGFFRRGGGEHSWRLLNNNDQRGDQYYHHQGKETTWVEEKLKDVKEFSEVVAGPKWKNLIRKLGKLFHKKERRAWQYDSRNYALNFDEGEEDDDRYNLGNGYSSRFAAPFSGDQERRSSAVL